MQGTKLELSLKASSRMESFSTLYDFNVSTEFERGLVANLMIWLFGWILVILNILYFRTATVLSKSISTEYLLFPFIMLTFLMLVSIVIGSITG